MKERQILLLYPDKRWVPESTIMGWCYDAQADCKIETKPYTIDEAIEALEHLGWITVSVSFRKYR